MEPKPYLVNSTVRDVPSRKKLQSEGRKKLQVTLVTEDLAKIGATFIIKKKPYCSKCYLKKICVDGLREGIKYRVSSIRSKTHRCPFTGSIMRVVEVTYAPIQALLPASKAMPGAVITFAPPSCNIKCPLKQLCIPEGLRKGDKVVITGIISKGFKCDNGLELTLVSLLPQF